MVKQIIRILVMAIVVNTMSVAHSADLVLDDDSKKLVMCMNTFAYAANVFLLQDKEGAAKSMILQQSRSQALLFSKHYIDGRIPSEAVGAFNQEGSKVKNYLDKNPTKIIVGVDGCVLFVNKFEARNEKHNIKMWGKSIDELTIYGAEKGRQAIGLE